MLQFTLLLASFVSLTLCTSNEICGEDFIPLTNEQRDLEVETFQNHPYIHYYIFFSLLYHENIQNLTTQKKKQN